MSIVGLTIDYGPFGFLDTYDPGHICNASGKWVSVIFSLCLQCGPNLTCLPVVRECCLATRVAIVVCPLHVCNQKCHENASSVPTVLYVPFPRFTQSGRFVAILAGCASLILCPTILRLLALYFIIRIHITITYIISNRP